MFANAASTLERTQRKKIFELFPEVRLMFLRAINMSELNLELSDYCFYIEKSGEKNWPLLFHRDSNLPSYLEVDDDNKSDFLKKSVMFRLTLDESDEERGALKVIPGSHINETIDAVDDGYAVEFVNTKAGEVIFFKPLLLHGSNKIKRACVRRVFQALCIERS